MGGDLGFQDGGWTLCIFIGTNGFLAPENMGIDINISSLSLLEIELWPKM